ncbi:MAG: protein-export chaperone SecB, partial [Hyphomicrobiales bacterium]
MAKKKSEPAGSAASGPAATGQAQQAPGPAIGILGQYVKDLSFESPNAPKSLQSPGNNPKLNININVQVARQSDDVYEVALLFEGKTNNDDGV